MTRKHFAIIAQALKESHASADVAKAVATALAQTNSAFNRAKFLEACGVSV